MPQARNPKRVFLGVAVGNGQEGVTRWETSMSLIRLAVTPVRDYEFCIVPGGGCDIAHARNLMVHEALTRTDCGIIGFLDSDVSFGPEHLLKLLAWFDHADIEFLAGLYPRKALSLIWSYGLWQKESVRHPGLWEVGEACTGALFFRADLAERLIAAHPETAYVCDEPKYTGETVHELFAMGPVGARDWRQDGKPYRRRMSEDFMFSMRVADLGVTRYADPKVQLGHVGAVDFKALHAQAAKK